jgi:hypothetical protein
MPNLPVTDRQVMLYMIRSQQHDQESAAAMAGFSTRTARRIDKDPRLPSQKRQPRTWRRRIGRTMILCLLPKGRRSRVAVAGSRLRIDK